MSKYRAQIIWDFEFDEDGYTENEREFLEWDKEDGETLKPRTPEQMAEYAKSELHEALWDNVKYNDIYRMIDVVEVKD